MTGRLEHEIKIEKQINNKLIEMPDYISDWYDNLKASGVTITSCKDYICKIHKFLQYINENIKEIEPKDIDLQTVQKYFISTQRKQNKDGEITYTSDSYRQGIWCCLNNFFNYMVITKRMNENYMNCIAKPKNRDLDRINEKRVLLNKDDFKRIMQIADEGFEHNSYNSSNENVAAGYDRQYTRNKAILLLFLTTGIRKTALTEINLEDMNLSKRIITVTDKGNKTHVYNLSPKLVETLKVWTRDREEIRKNTKTKSHALFLTEKGERLHPNTIVKIVSTYCEKALGYPVSPHKLRAGFCSVLCAETGDIEFVRRAVGHSNIATTQRYIVTNGDERKKAASLIDSMME